MKGRGGLRCRILEDGELITTEYLPKDLVGGNSTSDFNSDFHLPTEGIPLAHVELQLVKQAVARTGGNLTQAAKLLDISRDQIRYRLKKDDKEKSLSKSNN